MIELKNVSKSFKNDRVLRKVNLKITRNGIYVIKGKSGCGKSTLLNIIGMMDEDYSGFYILDGLDVKKYKDRESLRRKYFTYLYQNPFFIENESVRTNLELADPSIDEERTDYYLSLVGMLNKKKSLVSSLSGGEKRRISLLTALIRKTPVLLMDELTSALDEENKILVMDLLKEFSKDRIIIFVSHEESIVENYAEAVIHFKEREIEYISSDHEVMNVVSDKKRTLSMKYIFSHVLHLFAYKKLRTMMSLITLCVGLISLGLSSELTTLAKNIVLKTFSSSYSTSSLVMKKNVQEECEKEFIALNEEDTERIYKIYQSDILEVRPLYYYNFEDNFYKNGLKEKDGKIEFSEIGLRHINEFFLFDEINEKGIALKDDEIYLSLNKGRMDEVISYLNVGSSLSRINNYLNGKPLDLVYEIENPSWEYTVSVPLKLKGVFLSENDSCKIIHSSPSFAEHFFEHTMQMKTSQDFNHDDLYPWFFKKIYSFVISRKSLTRVLGKMMSSSLCNEYDIHLAKEKFSPLFYKEREYAYLFLTYSPYERLNTDEIENVMEEENMSSYYFTSSSSYYLVDEALIRGFAFPAFISNDKSIMEEYADQNEYTSSSLGMYQGSLYEDTKDLLYGDILSSSKENSFCVKTYYDKYEEYKGEYPSSSDEVIVSRKMKERYDLKEGGALYFMFLKEVIKEKEEYKNKFEIIPLTVKGFYDDDKCSLLCETSWLSTFFIENIFDEYGSFLSDECLMEYSSSVNEELIDRLNKKYPSYIFSSPLLGLYEEVDKICSSIQMVLSMFSLFTLITAFITLVSVIYLFFEENKGEIAAYITLGYSKSSIILYFFSFGFILSFYAFFLSSLNLFFISTFLSEEENLFSSMRMNGTLTLLLFLISLFFSFLASFISLISIKGKKNIDYISMRN